MDEEFVIELSEANKPDLVNLHKMLFIYNAVLAGWTVRKCEGERFEFVRTLDETVKREVNLSDYIKKFILHNLTFW